MRYLSTIAGSFRGSDSNAVPRLLLLLLLLLSLPAIVPQDVQAYGLGFGGSLATGKLKDKSDSLFGGATVTTKYDENRYSVGGYFDSNLGQQRLFNYRLGVAYQAMKADADNSEFDLKGIAVENHFGFSLHRSATVRLWAGPLVKAEYLSGDETNYGDTSHESVFGIGIGPVVGLNLRLNDSLFLAGTIGYIFQSDVEFFGDRRENYGFLALALFFGQGRDQGPAARP